MSSSVINTMASATVDTMVKYLSIYRSGVCMHNSFILLGNLCFLIFSTTSATVVEASSLPLITSTSFQIQLQSVRI
jgi:hypothetical protein